VVKGAYSEQPMKLIHYLHPYVILSSRTDGEGLSGSKTGVTSKGAHLKNDTVVSINLTVLSTVGRRIPADNIYFHPRNQHFFII
jgi:hypothetical protein